MTSLELGKTGYGFIFSKKGTFLCHPNSDILDQINLRSKILAGGILYLEYFYFILYLLIIAVAINAMLFSQKPNIRWLQYQQSLIPKLLYWPGMLTLLLVFTLFVF